MTRYFNPDITRHFFNELDVAAAKLGFTVEAEAIVGGFQEYVSKIAAAAEAGTLPDIFSTSIATLQFIKNGRLLPIQDLWDKIGQSMGGWHPIATAHYTHDGVAYALDDGIIPAFVHYRRDLIEAAGFKLPFADMNEMEACCKALTRPDQNQYGCGFSMSPPDDLHHIEPYLWAYGGMLQDASGAILLNSPACAQGLRRFTDLYAKLKVAPPGSINWDSAGNNQAYLSGQAAIVANPGSLLASARRNDSPIDGLLDKTFVGPYPQALKEYGPQCLTQPGTGFAINAATPYPDVAKELLLQLWSPENYVKLMRMGQGYLFPALMDAYGDEYFTRDPWNRQIVETVMPIMHDESRAGKPELWTNMWSTWGGRAIQRVLNDQWEPERAMSEAQQTVEQARDAYLKKEPLA